MADRDFRWTPDPARAATSRLGRLLRACGHEPTPEGYRALHRWSVDEPERFWRAWTRELGLEWRQPFSRVLDESRGAPFADWFVDGRLNAAWNAIGRWLPARADQPAVLWEGDGVERRELSLGELASAVARGAAELRDAGVRPGDTVLLFLPMLPETVAAVYACLAVGAIAVPCFSGYGADAVGTRLADSGARVVVTADGFLRRGAAVTMKRTADAALEHAARLGGPPVERVLVVPRLRESGATGGAEIPWSEGRDRWWPSGDGGSAEASALFAAPDRLADTAAGDPCMILYTSGTTGRPKGVVATHGGFPLKIATDMALCFDVEAGDRMLWVTDLGWVMGPWLLLGTLTLGATMVLCEGVPDHPGPDRLWATVARHRVTHLGLAPTVARALREHGSEPVRGHDLARLRVLGSTGEAWNPEPWEWLFREVGGERLPIVNYSGGTEIGGGILGCSMIHPLEACGFSMAIPGIDADVLDEDGAPLRERVGELIVRRPWPGMTRGFWKDQERYLETYWSRFPGVWRHGDWARVGADGSWTIEGRSDDTIKIAGKRLGPAEVESLLVDHPDVVEAAAIEVPHEVKGGALVCFVVLRGGVEPAEALRRDLRERVARGLGKAMRPESVWFASALPKTRNAKIMRRLIRAAWLERHPPAAGPAAAPVLGDLSALDDPATLEAIRSAR